MPGLYIAGKIRLHPLGGRKRELRNSGSAEADE